MANWKINVVLFIGYVICVVEAKKRRLEGEEEEEEEKANPTSVAIAATLMASICFQMSLFYLIGHKDEDIRQVTYDIICKTISIFCAVLIFGSINDLMEAYVLKEDDPPSKKCLLSFCHMVFWFLTMQLALAYISGAVGAKPESIEAVELQMKSTAMLLAHITGFAAINSNGNIQQAYFSSSWYMSLIALVVSFCIQYTLQFIFTQIRLRVAMADDGTVDEFEFAWDEEAAESENDVMSLTLSFTLIQSLRFAVGGHLPNVEGEELGGLAFEHTGFEAGIILAFGLVCLGVSAAGLLKHGRIKPEDEEKARMQICLILTAFMSFAWCFFYGFRWLLAAAGKAFFEGDDTLLCVVLAMVLSGLCLISIFGLDAVADKLRNKRKAADGTADVENDGEDDEDVGQSNAEAALRNLMANMGILIGFAWEQTFDASEAALAEVMPSPHISKLVLAIFSVAILIPAWRYHILPMVLLHGWKFGFVVDHAKKMHGDLSKLEKAHAEHIEQEEFQKQKKMRAKIEAKGLTLAVEESEHKSPTEAGSKDGFDKPLLTKCEKCGQGVAANN